METSAMTLWVIEILLLMGLVTLIWAMLDILGSDYHADGER
jgi:hypothetical protein